MRAIEAATALITRQHGVAHVAQLRACGLTDAAVAGRVRSGSWTLVAPDVVAVAGAPETSLRTVWTAV